MRRRGVRGDEGPRVRELQRGMDAHDRGHGSRRGGADTRGARGRTRRVRQRPNPGVIGLHVAFKSDAESVVFRVI